MTKTDFISNIKVGSKIKTHGNTYVCTEASNGFMYSFKNVDTNSDNPTFMMFGVTDASVKDIELGGDA